MSKSQAEQSVIKTHLESNTSRLETQSQQQSDNKKWLTLIREYADIKELDTDTLNQLIKKIVVYEDFDDDLIRQTVEIHFNFVNHADKHNLTR